MNAEPEDLEEDEEEEDDPVLLAAAFDEVKRRALAANIPFELRDFYDGGQYIQLQMPAGRENRTISLFGLDDIQDLLSVPFETFVAIGPYDGICSYSNGTIEAAIRPLQVSRSMHFLWRRIRGGEIGRDDTVDPLIMRMEDSPTNLVVAIAPVTSVLRVFSRPRNRRGFSLQITGAPVTQHDQALALLEKIANAVFFQIDVCHRVPLSLARASLPNRRQRGVTTPNSVSDLQFPKSEYNPEPMSLYWYGRSAVGMPLLQYLAFYQVLEFYFPTYAQHEAHRRVKTILRNPAFDAHSDADVSRVLSAIRDAGRRQHGDEQSQLRATIRNCVNSAELLAFLQEDDSRKAFLSKSKALKARKIAVDSKEVDLCDEAARRIYDIRCMIVHTKNSDSEADLSLLLPFSKEAEALEYDIELLQFIAREVLIATSNAMRISL